VKEPLIRGNAVERMTGIEPALSAWEAGESTSQEVFQAQTWSFEGSFGGFSWRGRGPWGAREVDQDCHRPTSPTLTA